MTDTTKPVEPEAWPKEVWLSFATAEANDFPLCGQPEQKYVPATALDAKGAEIERLTDLLNGATQNLEDATTRAEKAESDRDALVAAAYEAAARICEKQAEEYEAEDDKSFCGPIAVRMRGLAISIRALTPADATAALEARDAAKVREGMKYVADRLKHEIAINPNQTYSDAIEWAESLAAIKEKQP